MTAGGIAMLVIGYALLYTGASNLFSGGQGWGFLQSLLNKGEANASTTQKQKGTTKSGSSSSLGFLSGLFDGAVQGLTGLGL